MFDLDIFESECSITEPGLQYRIVSNQDQNSIFNCVQFDSKPSRTQISRNIHSVQSDLSFVQVDFFSTQPQQTEQEAGSQLAALLKPQPTSKGQEQKGHNQQDSTNNLTNYILKHCFKQVATEQFKSQVQDYCRQLSVTYEQFKTFWKQQQEQHLRKHIGVNYFLKMMKGKSPFLQVLQYFLIVYLRCHYPFEVVSSSKQKKEMYLQGAVKVLYLIQLPKVKCHQLIRQAQTGLDH